MNMLSLYNKTSGKQTWGLVGIIHVHKDAELLK